MGIPNLKDRLYYSFNVGVRQGGIDGKTDHFPIFFQGFGEILRFKPISMLPVRVEVEGDEVNRRADSLFPEFFDVLVPRDP